MIDVRELRIGNLVDIKGSAEKVVSVDSFGVSYKSKNNCEYPTVMTQVKPIPITEDWLLKLGFEGVDYICPETLSKTINSEFVIQLDSFNNLVVQTDFSFGIFEIAGYGSLCFSNDIIKSVHQLQNLYFALTGKELNGNIH